MRCDANGRSRDTSEKWAREWAVRISKGNAWDLLISERGDEREVRGNARSYKAD